MGQRHVLADVLEGVLGDVPGGVPPIGMDMSHRTTTVSVYEHGMEEGGRVQTRDVEIPRGHKVEVVDDAEGAGEGVGYEGA